MIRRDYRKRCIDWWRLWWWTQRRLLFCVKTFCGPHLGRLLEVDLSINSVSPVPTLLLNVIDYRVGCARLVGAVAIEVYPLAAPTGRCCCPPRGDGERGGVLAGAWRESLPTPPAHIRRMRPCLPRSAVLSQAWVR